ncbi:glycosyltransferase family 4 protein [Oceanobacillus aidingensis]|uniref:Glycosyltransferase family 4 protein n=1 Tax=Oceanobacillus aidingensis TaxID=645964 RepID=A0ABV9JUH5_9BACI
MKKTLIISQNFYPEIGSAGNRMKNIYLLLKEQGLDVEILTTQPSYPNKHFYDENHFWDNTELNEDKNIHRIKIMKKKYSRNIFNRLFYYLEMAIKMIFFVLFSRNKYDVIFVSSPPIFVAIVGLIAKYRFRAKLILDIRDLWPESLKGVGVFNYSIVIGLFEKIEKLLYIQANNIVVNSKGFIGYIVSKSKVFADKITYLPNGARNYEINISEEKGSDDFKVIYAGNLGLAQDVTAIMNLAKELNERNIKLTIIGYGIRRDSLIDYIKKKDLKNVEFVNPTTRSECFKIISNHQVGIVTLVEAEVFETVLPGKVIDYMTCGVPVVASVSGFSEKMIEDGKTGFVSHNLDELIKCIEELKENDKLYDEMSLNGRKYVEHNYLWEKNIDHLIRVIS